jgi:hypothetical protein
MYTLQNVHYWQWPSLGERPQFVLMARSDVVGFC